MDVAESETEGRRRRGWIIAMVVVLLVVVPLALNSWFGSQADERAEDLAETVRGRAQSLNEGDLEALRLQEISGDGSGGYASVFGLEGEFQAADLEKPVRLVFQARSGWASRCVKVVLTAGSAETEIVAPEGHACTLAD